MPLRIHLKPFERLIINGASLRNGERSTNLLIENTCKFLRESEIIPRSGADTACKRLCVTLQLIYLADHRWRPTTSWCGNRWRSCAACRRAPLPGGDPGRAREQAVSPRLKIGRELVAYERSLMERLSGGATNAA